MARLIEDYAVIGHLQTAALVCRDGDDRLALPAHDRLARVFRSAARHRGRRPLAARPVAGDYGGTEVDAALLRLPRLGFMPYSDERASGTAGWR